MVDGAVVSFRLAPRVMDEVAVGGYADDLPPVPGGWCRSAFSSAGDRGRLVEKNSRIRSRFLRLPSDIFGDFAVVDDQVSKKLV